MDAVGLNELMKHAGFTQGGFYNHLGSKADLVAEGLASAMAEGTAELAAGARAPDETTGALQGQIGRYLSRAYRDNIDCSCSFPEAAGCFGRQCGTRNVTRPYSGGGFGGLTSINSHSR